MIRALLFVILFLGAIVFFAVAVPACQPAWECTANPAVHDSGGLDGWGVYPDAPLFVTGCDDS